MLARRNVVYRTAVFAVLFALAIGVSAFSVEVKLLSTEKTGAPGTVVTHVFGILNDAAGARTYSLTYASPVGWTILGAPSSLSVQAGEEGTLFVTITIPAGAPAATYQVSLTAEAQSDANDTGTASGDIIVTPINEVEMQAPTGSSVAPGGSVEYEFVLVNRGNAQDSFSISAFSTRGLPLILSLDAVDLAPQERAVFTVRLAVAADEAPGRDVLTVLAQSALYDSVETDADVFTTILPPAPEAVGGTLMEQLPARVRLSIDKNVMSGVFDSRLNFSLSGQILGGYYSSYFSASDPLGPGIAEIGSFSMLYRRDPVTYSLGNVSLRVSDLLRTSCFGGSVVLDREYVDLWLVGGGSNGETRFSGRMALGPERANGGFAYLGIRDPVDVDQSVWSATAYVEPIEDWSMRLEGALGIDSQLTSRALFFNTTIDTSGYFFSGDVYSVGTYFPGQKQDSAGIEVSQRLRLEAISISASLSHIWDNVNKNPLLPIDIEDELGFSFTATPLEDGPTFSSTLEFSWDRYDDLSTKSDLSTLLSTSMTETAGVFPYLLSTRVLDQVDNVLGSHTRTLTFSQGAGLSVDAFYLFLQLTQERVIDVLTDTQLSSDSDVSLRFRPETALHEASVTFQNSGDDFDLSTSLYIHFTDDLDLTFDGSISWDRNDATDVSFAWGITLSGTLELPIPFLRTKGRIEGRAFIDTDGDGRFSVGDIPASGIVVAGGRSEVSTNSEGFFRFPPFYPGEYSLVASQLPLGAEAGAAVVVDLAAGETTSVDLLLTPVVIIAGEVFDDEDRDGLRGDTELGFQEVRVVVQDADGAEAYNAYSDLTGAFVVSDVLPGNYLVSIDPSSLPERFEFTTSVEIPVALPTDEETSVVFGGYVREREVVITFQPPTADFEYSPTEAAVGVAVTFDGSLSFDFDGEIIGYTWDFNEDGEADATTEVATWTFGSPGIHSVSLTVLDDAGNRDTVTQSLEVVANAPDSGTPTPPSGSGFMPPIADFSYMPAAPRAGETVIFNGLASSDPDGIITAYAWDFDGDGEIDSRTSLAEYAFQQAGTFAVSLTVTDSDGNTDTATHSVAILETSGAQQTTAASPPIADIRFAPDAPTAGTAVSFNGTGSLDLDGLVTAFAWDFDADGTTDSEQPIVEYTFSQAGTFTVSLTVTDNDGNTDTISVSVPVEEAAVPQTTLQPPVADFAYMPAEPQPGEIVLFNATLSRDLNGQIAGYAWDFESDGEIDSVAAVVDHVFDTAGFYNVTLAVTDNDGNKDSTTIRVQVGDAEAAQSPASSAAPSTLQPPIADFTYKPASPISGQTVAFDGSTSADLDGEIVSYAWDFNDDGVVEATESTATYAFEAAGTYSISLTVTDDAGSSDTLTLDVEVTGGTTQMPSPAASVQPPIADFTYLPASPRPVQTVSFNASLSTDLDGEIAAYAWDFDEDGQLDAESATADYMFADEGEYPVSLTVTDDGGNTDTVTLVVSVSEPTPIPGTSLQPPVADFSYMPAAPRAGELVMFNASTSTDFDGELIAYAWDLDKDGQPDSTDVVFVHVFPEPGNYTVSLTVTDDGGNTDTLSITIAVE